MNCLEGHSPLLSIPCPFPYPLLMSSLHFPTYPFSPYPPCSVPSPNGTCGSTVSFPSWSGQSPAAKCIFMPKQGTWFRVDGLANWGDAFTYLRNLQWGTRSDPKSEIGRLGNWTFRSQDHSLLGAKVVGVCKGVTMPTNIFVV